jgi:hypothetical protein
VEPRTLSWPEALDGQADGDYFIKTNARQISGGLETIRDLLEADLWSLCRKCRMLAQSLDEKLFFPVH